LTLDLLEDGNIREFGFDRCFSELSTQGELFDTCARPVVDQVFEGFNGSVLAYVERGRSIVIPLLPLILCVLAPCSYGQTGTGKTYTMGLLESSQDLLPSSSSPDKTSLRNRVRRKGIIPQTLHEVFDRVSRFGSSREVIS